MLPDWVDEDHLTMEAEALARLWGLDPRRVVSVFYRLAEAGWLWPNFPSHTPLDVAIRDSEPAEALRLFESSDLAALSQRYSAVSYLSDSATPFLTLDELASELECLASACVGADSELPKTGYPQKRWGSAWLEQHIVPINLTRLPASVWDPPRPPWLTEPEPGESFSYLWQATPPFGPNWRGAGPFGAKTYAFPALSLSRRGVNRLLGDDGRPVQVCGYDAAAAVLGMPDSMADRLERERSRLLSAKGELLNLLARAVRTKDVDGVWPRALQLLTSKFLSDEMDFYLEVDELHRELEVHVALSHLYRRQPLERDWQNNATGGMTDLFTVIGHVEEELRIGVFQVHKDMFRDVLGPAEMETSYFRLYGGQRAAVDAVMDAFLKLEPSTESYWKNHKARVDAALAEEFDEEVTVRTRVKRKHVPRFQPSIQSFADWQASQMNSTGSLASIGEATPGDYVRRREHGQTQAGASSASEFRYSQDFRTVVLGEETFPLTIQQAQVVEMLYDAYENKTPALSQGYILERLGARPNAQLRDTFRRSKAWGKLVVTGERRGTFRLNL